MDRPLRSLVKAALGGACALALLGPIPARAEFFARAHAGGFASFAGDFGYSALASVLGSEEDSSWRFGGEVEWRAFDTDLDDGVYGLSNSREQADIRSLLLRAMMHYRFGPEDSPVRPYLGGGLGLSINTIDVSNPDDGVDTRVTRVASRHVIGFDALAVAGVEAGIPGVDGLTLFLEGRVGMNYLPVGVRQHARLHTDWVSLGGGNAILGAHWSW